MLTIPEGISIIPANIPNHNNATANNPDSVTCTNNNNNKNTSHQTVLRKRRLIGEQNRVNLFLRQNELLGDANADQPTVSYLDARNL
jgi:hypothetical protein